MTAIMNGFLIQQVETFTTRYMQKHANPKLLFHNIWNTRNIVAITEKIASQHSLTEKELFIVKAAAWFLYVGYFKDYLNPEEAGARVAEDFLTKAAVEEDTIQSIKKCIAATKLKPELSSAVEQIIWDAHTFYYGTAYFSKYNKLLFKELKQLGGDLENKNEWIRKTIINVETHRYYTEYCLERLEPKKQENLKKLKKKNSLLALTNNSINQLFENTVVPVNEKIIIDKKGKVGDLKSADRTIETMFRTTSANSQRLSSQADTKAHIMISVNTIIISILLSVVVRKMEEYPNLILPIILFLLVCLVTIVFSILATRPNVKKNHFTEADVEQNKVNMLFFGNFFTLTFDDYSNYMLKIMEDKNHLYLSLLKNLYEQGIVLARKYKMLKISYDVFMYGLVVSVIVFFIASNWFGAE